MVLTARVIVVTRRAQTGGGPGGGQEAEAGSYDEDEEHMCFICRDAFCAGHPEQCCRVEAHLECCGKTMCTGCLLRQAARCPCDPDCERIIIVCPFCKQVCPLSVMDTFLGHQPVCHRCTGRAASAAIVAAASAAAAAAAAGGDQAAADRQPGDDHSVSGGSPAESTASSPPARVVYTRRRPCAPWHALAAAALVRQARWLLATMGWWW